MSKPFAFGLNIKKKPGLVRKPAPQKRTAVFDDDSDNEKDQPDTSGQAEEEITELGDDDFASPSKATGSHGSREGKSSSKSKSSAQQPPPPPSIRSKKKADDASAPPHQLRDLSSALTARKYAEAAEKEDPSIYDYDAAYDSFKAPSRNSGSSSAAGAGGAQERKPQHMANLKKMAEVRERDRKIAEDKKMKRDREAEGDEFADKEKFVTDAYRRQQEENRRMEEEEKRREEEEARKNEAGGMTGFYKQLLERDDRRRAEIMKTADEQQKKQKRSGAGDRGGAGADEREEKGEKEEEEKLRTEADVAREINAKGGSVAINEDGQVVDKRELLTGGLNVGATRKKADEAAARREREADASRGRSRDDSFGGGSGTGGGSGWAGKQAMRDRQSRMLEAQYEQALKRSRDEEKEELQKVEVAAKSRKTDAEISSAKERYLARKRAEAEAKNGGG